VSSCWYEFNHLTPFLGPFSGNGTTFALSTVQTTTYYKPPSKPEQQKEHFLENHFVI